MRRALEAGASDHDLEHMMDEMENTRFVPDPAERAEFVSSWKASGVTCVFQNAGREILQSCHGRTGADQSEEIFPVGGRYGDRFASFGARFPAQMRQAAPGKVAPESEVRREGRSQLLGGKVEETGGSVLVKGSRDACGGRVGKRGAVPAAGQENDLPRGGECQCWNGHGRRSELSGFAKRREYREEPATSQGSTWFIVFMPD